MENCFKNCQQRHEVYSDVTMSRVSSFCLVFFSKDTTEMLKRQSVCSIGVFIFGFFIPFPYTLQKFRSVKRRVSSEKFVSNS